MALILIKIYPAACFCQDQLAGHGVVKRSTAVKCNGRFYGFNRVIVKIGPAVCRLHERRRIKRSVTGNPEPIVGRQPFIGPVPRLIRDILNTGIKIKVAGLAAEYCRIAFGTGIEMTDETFACG